jgi:hypothetical protein
MSMCSCVTSDSSSACRWTVPRSPTGIDEGVKAFGGNAHNDVTLQRGTVRKPAGSFVAVDGMFSSVLTWTLVTMPSTFATSSRTLFTAASTSSTCTRTPTERMM